MKIIELLTLTGKPKKLADKVRQARLKKNMSQSDLAHEVGCSLKTISRLENGQAPKMALLLRILTLLGCVNE